jgi:hypothetical protein
MVALPFTLRRVTRTALAVVASVSLAVDLSCAPPRALPPMEQPSTVQLKSPAVIVVRNAADESSYGDVLTIYGLITAVDETSLRIDVRQLADAAGIRVANDVAGTATVSRSDVRRIFGPERESHQPRPVIGYIAVPLFLAASAMVLVFLYKGLTVLL